MQGRLALAVEVRVRLVEGGWYVRRLCAGGRWCRFAKGSRLAALLGWLALVISVPFPGLMIKNTHAGIVPFGSWQNKLIR